MPATCVYVGSGIEPVYYLLACYLPIFIYGEDRPGASLDQPVRIQLVIY
jgi:hypothetical protein